MTGRMESVENLVRQRERFAPQRQIFHPSHRPLEIAGAIPTFPQPDDDSLLQTYKPQNQGDTSTGLTQGTFLLGLDIGQLSQSIFSSKDEPEDGGWGFLSRWGSFRAF